MWHKVWAQPSQGVAGRLAMSRRGGAQGIQRPKVVQGGNLAAQPSCMAGRPDMFGSPAQSSARALP
jgi:hypothetical protein